MLHDPIAAPTQTFTVGDPSSAGGRGAGLTNRLPCWAQTKESTRLLAAIKFERPERTRAITMTLSGGVGPFGYQGRNASQLRAIFDRTFASMIDWVAAARVPTPPGCPMKAADQARYDFRRRTVIEWAEVSGPDAVIARLIGDAP